VTGGAAANPPAPPAPAATPEQLAAVAESLARSARSDATRRSYATAWGRFAAWCEANGQAALPASPETVRQYLGAHADTLAPATLQRHLVAIAQIHRQDRHEPPTRSDAVREVMTGIRRMKGSAPDAKAPLLLDDLKAIVEALPQTVLWGVRDRALLLIGWAGGLRRSELVGLDVADVQQTREGLILTIRRSKTDQEGEGHKIGIAAGQNPQTCPVLAYQEWLQVSGIKRGPVFRPIDRHGNIREMRLSGKAVAGTVKSHVQRVGLDPLRYAGHSLRAGLATSAAASGVPERVIMATTRHKSVTMLRRYIRDGELFRDNAAKQAGL
jgi:site-specific recombinase XerD